MGITAATLKMLSRVLPGKRVLSLGYPDLAMSAEDVQEILGVTPTKFTSHGAWHGVNQPLPETVHVFDLIGSSVDCVDISSSRGIERIVDLNQPCDLGEYDLVLDSGTTEHCFNVGQAIINAAHAVKPGGAIFHCFPMCVMNHGFWNASPTLFNDFYTQNDWSVQIAGLVQQTGECYEVPAYRAFDPAPKMYLSVFAVRPKERKPMRFPTQQKYIRFPNLTLKAA
jgi:SAM-dependent methyltransferase